MAVSLNPRAERLLARLPRFTVYSALELLLLLLIAIQCARLFWAALTPLGPVGEWKALDLMRPATPVGAVLGSLDPFFRQPLGAPGAPSQAPAVVTALDIRLHGITANQATGGGSAIIGDASGEQRSYLVGEEIMPGVTLTGVGFDHVTITRNGAPEQLYLDQSSAPAGPTPGSAPPAPQRVVTPPPVVPNLRPAPPPPPPQPPPAPPPAPTAQTLKVSQ